MLDILIFSPHPDDAELGCGGAILNAINSGYAVGIIDITAGEMGSKGTKEIRLQEAEEAKNILGVKIRENLEYADSFLEFSNLKDIILTIADKIRQYQPKIVLAPYWDDRHPDHNIVSNVVTKACHYAKLKKINLKHSFHKISQIIYYEINGQFTPTFIMDISATFEKKKEAIMAYKSQFEKFTKEYLPFPLVERNKYYGSLISVENGEAFLLKNPLKLVNWKELL